MPITILFTILATLGVVTFTLLERLPGEHFFGLLLVGFLALYCGGSALMFAILEGQDALDRRSYRRRMVQRGLAQIARYEVIPPASVYDRATQDLIDAGGDPWAMLEELGLILAWAYRDVTGSYVPVTDLTCRLGEHGCGAKVNVEVEEYRLDRVQSNSNYGFQAIHQVCWDEAEAVMEAEMIAWEAANPI